MSSMIEKDLDLRGKLIVAEIPSGVEGTSPHPCVVYVDEDGRFTGSAPAYEDVLAVFEDPSNGLKKPKGPSVESLTHFSQGVARAIAREKGIQHV